MCYKKKHVFLFAGDETCKEGFKAWILIQFMRILLEQFRSKVQKSDVGF